MEHDLNVNDILKTFRLYLSILYIYEENKLSFS